MTKQDRPQRHFVSREVAGVPFAVASLDEAVEWLITEAAPNRLPVNVRLANAYNVALAAGDASYRKLLSAHGVNFPDGTPVVWAMNRGRGARSRAGRVRGPSLFTAAMARSVGAGTRHFLLGSTRDTLAALETSLSESNPGVTLVGSYSPPFAPVDENFLTGCVEEILKTEADVVWVGLGTPKQDVVGTELAARLKVTTVNVGAAFDFAAGTLNEAPVWVQRSGFEWLHRLASEPRRLWRRYLLGNLAFIWAVVRTRTTFETADSRFPMQKQERTHQ